MAQKERGSRPRKLTTVQRRAANDESFGFFAASYDPRWRLTKLVSIGLSLEQRDELIGAMRKVGYPQKDLEAYVYQQATNGLICSALSETVMYCEDFLALLKYVRDQETFVRRMTRYAAGGIPKVATRVISSPDSEILRAFMIPPINRMAGLPNWDQNQPAISEACKRIIDFAKEIARFYLDHLFFHEQYKHGLKLPLAPFAATLPEEEMAERKKSSYGTVIAYDNDSIETARKKGKFERSTPTMMLGPATQPFLRELQQNRDLLRYHMLPHIHIDTLIELGKKVSLAIECLVSNRSWLSHPKDNQTNTVALPGKSYPNRLIVDVSHETAGLTPSDYSAPF